MRIKLRHHTKGNRGYYYFDLFLGYYVDETGKKKSRRVRESLGISFPIKPANPFERAEKKNAKATAEELLFKRNEDYLRKSNNLDNIHRKKEKFFDYFDNYIKNKNTSISDTQVFHTLRNHLVRFRGNQQLIQDIDYAYCRDFAEFLKNVQSNYGTPLSSSSINSYFKKFKLVLKEMIKEEIIQKNPADKVIIGKPIHKPKVFLTSEEIQLLVQEPLKQENLKRMFLLGCFTGLRHSDIKRLKWSDYIVEGERHYLQITISKTKEHLKLPLTKDAIKIIGEPEGEDDPIIRGLAYSGYSNHLLKQWAYRAGVKKDITPHIARHTFATQFASKTKDYRSLQYLLGHKDIRTTQVYAKLIEQDVVDSIDKMEDIL